jgi:prophage regulatory protein
MIRRHEVEQLVGLQRSSIYRLMSLGEFPRPFRLTKSGKAVGWKASAVEKWIESRAVSTGVNPPTEARG